MGSKKGESAGKNKKRNSVKLKEEQELLLRQAAHWKRRRIARKEMILGVPAAEEEERMSMVECNEGVDRAHLASLCKTYVHSTLGNNANKHKSTTSMSKVNGDGTGQNRRPSNDIFKHQKKHEFGEVEEKSKEYHSGVLNDRRSKWAEGMHKRIAPDMDREVHFVTTCADIAINEKEINRKKIYKLMESVAKDSCNCG